MIILSLSLILVLAYVPPILDTYFNEACHYEEIGVHYVHPVETSLVKETITLHFLSLQDEIRKEVKVVSKINNDWMRQFRYSRLKDFTIRR